MISKHFIVEGVVQGVSFRYSTKQQAAALGITGWVRNLSDGSVEVFASGSQDTVEALQAWLWQGPQYAKVKNVVIEAVPLETFDSFDIRF